MSLMTKSIRARKTINDGIRICVMRIPNKDTDFDIWMPNLAPSKRLLCDYQNKKINWQKYVSRFEKEVMIGNKEYIDLLAEIAKNRKITILCWEKTPKKCHRRLVAEEVKKRFKDIKVIVK